MRCMCCKGCPWVDVSIDKELIFPEVGSAAHSGTKPPNMIAYDKIKSLIQGLMSASLPSSCRSPASGRRFDPSDASSRSIQPFRSHSIIPPPFSDPFFDSAFGSGKSAGVTILGLAFFGVRLLACEIASLFKQRSMWSFSSWLEVEGPSVAAQMGHEGPSK